MLPSGSKRTGKEKQRANTGGERLIGRSSSADVVDVYGFRMLIWCRKYAGWAISNEHEKRLKNPC